MNSEISYANTSDHIVDWWVDLWDNINLVDIKERYNAIDSNDDLQIWITGQTREITVDTEIVPQKITATLNNYPGMSTSELFVKSYTICNNSGAQLSKGTDRVFSVYEDINKEQTDILVQDGDIKKDIFTKYDYIGENYGEYNYMISKQIRSGFLQKVNSETIKVTLQTPLLGLMRGHRVNFVRYVNDDKIENKMKTLEESGIVDRNVESNIPLSEYEIESDSGNGKFVIDKTVSGQYLIWGVNITYTNNSWDYTLTLTKPALSTVSIINNE